MKSKLMKILSLAMALTLVASLAACGGNGEDETTTGAAGTTVEDVAAPENPDAEAPVEDPSAEETEVVTEIVTDKEGHTQIVTEKVTKAPAKPGEPSKAPDKPNTPDKPGTPDKPAMPKPADVNAGVKAYNDALKQVKSQKANVTRKLTKKSVVPIGDLDKLGDISGTFARGSGPVNAPLSALNAADVASYSVSESGNTYVLTFTLKNVEGGKGTSAALKHGKGGYMYFLTMEEVAKVTMDIGKAIGGDGFNINIQKDKSTIDLQGGKFVVKIDKTTGKMTGATLDFTEVIKGKCTTSLLPGTLTADLIGVGNVKYTLG